MDKAKLLQGTAFIFNFKKNESLLCMYVEIIPVF